MLGVRQLGYGNTDSVGDVKSPATAGPVPLGAGRTATAITAGRRHTCAILDTGDVRCWGSSNLGTSGPIGDDEPASDAPLADLGGENAVAISAGWDSTCALVESGEVYCWGVGRAARYSNGDTSSFSGTSKIDLGGRTASHITLGFEHACVILDDDELYCWGEGDDGRLGYGNTDDVGDGVPAMPESPLSGGAVDVGAGRTVLTASAGDKTTCALLDNLTVRCWGSGPIVGQGIDITVGDDELPSDVPVINYNGTASYTPLSPDRILDTRFGTGAPTGKVAPDESIDVQITGQGGVPDTGVYAVVLNVTLAGATNPGFVTSHPTGTTRPTASNINVTAVGQNAPNSVIVPIGQDGKVTLYTSGGGHLIADVFGYFEQTGSATAGRLIGVSPSRIFDTRPSSPLTTSPKGKLDPGETIESHRHRHQRRPQLRGLCSRIERHRSRRHRSRLHHGLPG